MCTPVRWHHPGTQACKSDQNRNVTCDQYSDFETASAVSIKDFDLNTLILKLLLSHQSKTLTSTISICSLLTHTHKNSISRHIIYKIAMSHMNGMGQLLADVSVNATFNISQI